MKSCSQPDCDRKHFGTGLCKMHYDRKRRTGSPEGMTFHEACTYGNCKGAHHAKGLCEKHYIRAQKHGDPSVNLRAGTMFCSVLGCLGDVDAKGLCHKHYVRMRTHGTTDDPVRKSKVVEARARLSEHERRQRRKESVRRYRQNHRDEYNARQRAYYQTVKDERAERYRQRYATDPEFRERELARNRARPQAEITLPYSGHRWLDMARQAVVGRRSVPLDDSAPWADDAFDDMGEAVLALLEGRDMEEAIREYRKKEYVARNLTIHMGDWKSNDAEQQRYFDKSIPTVESAEDEVLAGEAVKFYHQTKFKNVHTKNRGMKQKTGQPALRRKKDAGWRKYA